MYLVRAEAEARLGNVTEALSDLNVIRSRAGLLGRLLAQELLAEESAPAAAPRS